MDHYRHQLNEYYVNIDWWNSLSEGEKLKLNYESEISLRMGLGLLGGLIISIILYFITGRYELMSGWPQWILGIFIFGAFYKFRQFTIFFGRIIKVFVMTGLIGGILSLTLMFFLYQSFDIDLSGQSLKLFVSLMLGVVLIVISILEINGKLIASAEPKEPTQPKMPKP